MKKRKIIYVITKGNWGGAQRYVFDLATNLPKEQFEVVVAVGEGSMLKQKLEGAGIRSVKLVTLRETRRVVPQNTDLSSFLELLRLFKQERPDIIHLNSSRAAFLGILATRFVSVHSFLFCLLNAKRYTLYAPLIIFTAHGWPFKEDRTLLIKWLIYAVMWFTVLLSHKTIVVSNDDRERAFRFPFIRHKITLIHSGIEPPIFADRDNARKTVSLKIGREIPDDTLLIGTIAELTKNKGLDYAIEAVKHTPHCCYIIIGGGEDKEKLQKIINDSGLDQRIFLAGQIENAAMLLKAFDIFLLPSLKEGLPYSLLEARAAGLPAIATDVGGTPEIIDDMRSGIIVKSKRPKEISDALTFLMAHPGKRKEFGDQLQKTVVEDFTLKRMVKKTIALYNTF